MEGASRESGVNTGVCSLSQLFSKARSRILAEICLERGTLLLHYRINK